MGAGLAAAEVEARTDCGNPRIHADLALQLILHFLHFQLDGFHICLQEREHHLCRAGIIPLLPLLYLILRHLFLSNYVLQ